MHHFSGKVFYPLDKSVLDHWSYIIISWHQAKPFLESKKKFLSHNCVIWKSRVAGSFGMLLEERSLVFGILPFTVVIHGLDF